MTAMYLLRLFAQSDPTRQIDSRTVGDGELVIGRDPGAGWKIKDPGRQISRAHCTLSFAGGEISVRDTSANGVQLGSTRMAVPKEQFTPISAGEQLLFGDFILLVEFAPADAMPEAAPIMADTGASPFAAPHGAELEGISAPRMVDPFASELRASALEQDPFADSGLAFSRSSGRSNRSGGGDDIWQQPPDARVGDWNNLSPGRQVDPTGLIGADRDWVEPEKDGPPDMGFGFDAPFLRPMVKIPAEAVIIPTDWDVAPVEPQAEPGVLPDEAYAQSTEAFDAPPPLEAPIAAPEPAFDAAPEPEPKPAPLAEPAPRRKSRAVQARGPMDQASAIAAFCAGANLDPDDFAEEDPDAVLRRVGEMYQQMVLGLADLLNERTSLKNEYRMVRTTVAPENNNPFKWAPPRRVAVDLLKGTNDGFMHGAPAVKESFEDLKKHLLCLLAGMRASLASTLRSLSPASVEAHVRPQTFALKSQRGSAAWNEYVKLYSAFQREADDNADSQINRDFRVAYERQLRELDDVSARS